MNQRTFPWEKPGYRFSIENWPPGFVSSTKPVRSALKVDLTRAMNELITRYQERAKELTLHYKAPK